MTAPSVNKFNTSTGPRWVVTPDEVTRYDVSSPERGCWKVEVREGFEGRWWRGSDLLVLLAHLPAPIAEAFRRIIQPKENG